MTRVALFLFYVIVVCIFTIGGANGVYQHKHSMKPPFLYGRHHNIPFWTTSQGTIATESYVRLTSDVQSRTGQIWNKEPITMKNFEVLFDFHIHNVRSPGADGMALWIAKDIAKEGEVFGYTNDFEGIGILFDTYDNNHNGDNPAVILIQNDGRPVDWDIDGDFLENQMARCVSHFRNPINEKATARITYLNGKLSVEMDTLGKGSFQKCWTSPVNIPEGYHFGITAATGGLTDFHDVLGFMVKSIQPNEEYEKRGKEQGNGRKRGWYDPYRASHADKVRAHDLKRKMDEDLQKMGRNDDIDNFGNEMRNKYNDDNDNKKRDTDYFEDLRKKIEKINKGKSTKNPNVVTSQKKIRDEPKKRMDLDAEDAEEEETNGGTGDLGLVILEALEEVISTIKKSSTKNDISQIVRRVENVADAQQSIGEMMISVNNEVKKEMTDLSKKLTEQTTKLSEEIRRLNNIINTVGGSVTDMKRKQNDLTTKFSEKTDELHTVVQSSNKFGALIYFIIFESVLVAGIYFYRKYTQEKRKKIL